MKNSASTRNNCRRTLGILSHFRNMCTPGMMYVYDAFSGVEGNFFLLIVPAASRGGHWCRGRSGCLPRALDIAILLGFVVLDIQAQLRTAWLQSSLAVMSASNQKPKHSTAAGPVELQPASRLLCPALVIEQKKTSMRVGTSIILALCNVKIP